MNSDYFWDSINESNYDEPFPRKPGDERSNYNFFSKLAFSIKNRFQSTSKLNFYSTLSRISFASCTQRNYIKNHFRITKSVVAQKFHKTQLEPAHNSILKPHRLLFLLTRIALLPNTTPQKQLHPTAFITKIVPEKMPTKQCMLLFYSNFDLEFSISHFYENAECFQQKLDKKCSCSISPNANAEANGNIFVLN